VLEELEPDSRIRVVWSPGNGGISAASSLALERATGDFVALLDHDDELAPNALFEVAKLLNAKPDTDFIYSDEDKLDLAGERCDPYFKPDWSPEHFLSCMYTCHLMVVRRSLLVDIGGFRKGFEGAQDYDVVLRLMERTDKIHHIPKILYHWRKIPESVASSGAAKTWAMDAGERALQDYVDRRGLDAAVAPGAAPGLYRVRHRIKDRPLVSIVIPTAGRTRDVAGQTIDLLLNCVKSIVDKTAYDNYEIVIADNGTITDASREYLKRVRHRRVTFRYSGPFNYSRKMNFGVNHSRGSHVVLFNDDIEVIEPEWIEAMLEYSQQPEIGAVGAKLLYPDGRLQHIGIVMGVCGMAAHAFHSHPGSSPGYGFSALVVRNYSTVTAACMMTRRELYDRFNGFDEKFAFDFNDTDYCLRLRQAGYRVVFTPYAQLYHLEAATTGLRKWDDAGLAEMRRRWTDVCEHDPYYNPNLTREFPDYRVRL
jgi:GT2 family glycosyltransferase